MSICPVPQCCPCQISLNLCPCSLNHQGLNTTADFWNRINPKHLQSGVISFSKQVSQMISKSNTITSTETGFYLIFSWRLTFHSYCNKFNTSEGKCLHTLPQKSFRLQCHSLLSCVLIQNSHFSFVPCAACSRTCDIKKRKIDDSMHFFADVWCYGRRIITSTNSVVDMCSVHPNAALFFFF